MSLLRPTVIKQRKTQTQYLAIAHLTNAGLYILAENEDFWK